MWNCSSPLLGIFALAVASAGASPASAQPLASAEACQIYTTFASDINSTLPKPIDEVTELIQVRVNCELRSVAYVKRILAAPDRLAAGWEQRKQLQHTQLNCNRDGIASFGWTAIDYIYGPDYAYLTTLRTSPADCAALGLPPATNAWQELHDALDLFVMEFRDQLPMRVDEITTLLFVAHAGGTVIYQYRVDRTYTSDEGLALESAVRNRTTFNVCSDQDTFFLLSANATMSYNYIDADGRFLFDFDVTLADCAT